MKEKIKRTTKTWSGNPGPGCITGKKLKKIPSTDEDVDCPSWSGANFETQKSKSNIDCLGAELEVLPQGLPAGLVWLNMAKNELTEVGFLPNTNTFR